MSEDNFNIEIETEEHIIQFIQLIFDKSINHIIEREIYQILKKERSIITHLNNLTNKEREFFEKFLANYDSLLEKIDEKYKL